MLRAQRWSWLSLGSFTATRDGVAVFRMGYGWLWGGPDNSRFTSLEQFAGPDFGVIFLHIAALTAIGAALYLLGFFRYAPVSTARAPQSVGLNVLLAATLIVG